MMCNPSHADRRSAARSVLAAALLCAASLVTPAHAAEDEMPQVGAVPDESGLDAHLAALRPAICASDELLCRHLKAFANGIPPCFPQGQRLTVGQAQVIADDGAVTASEYFAVRVERVREVTLVQSQHVYSENAEEKQAAEELVQSLKSGVIDPGNALYRYLESRNAEVPQLLAQVERRALVVRSEGPALYLRQAGKLLFAAMPDATISVAGQPEGPPGVLFAVLPAAASCE
jgi:hypothetical protein